MAALDYRKLAARFAGRPAIPRYNVVTGATINTNIALTGVNKEDQLIAVLRFVGAGVAVTDVSNLVAETSVTSDGNIQLTTTDTSSDKLLVIWLKVRL